MGIDIKDFYRDIRSRIPQERLNFLLVAPRFVNAIGDGYAFPLGLACVSASMKEAGFNVFTINLNHIDGEIHDILAKKIKDDAINVVCTGGLSIHYSVMHVILRAAKKVNPDIITVVGGGIITAEPDVAMQALEYVDYGVVGEGEITICELARAIENKQANKEHIPGIVFKKDGTYHVTEKREEIRDLDALPMADYESFDFETYLTLPPTTPMYNVATRRMAFVEGSRSCPYQCTFCFNTTGNRYRQRSLESIVKDIRHLQEKHDVGFVYMVDELFATNIERVKTFNREMTKLNMAWTCAFRVDNITPELVEELKNSNFAYMLLGLESADDSVLKSMNKRITVAQIEEALKLGFDAGIHCGGNFIFGDINETFATATNTLEWWKKYYEYNISLTFITTYPGTYIYKYACRNNIISDPVKYLKSGCPEVNISKMSDEEMGIIAKEIFVTPYKYSKQIQDFSYEVISHGRAKGTGKCYSCGALNKWDNIPLSMLFASNRRIQCIKCGQKHSMPLVEQLKNDVIAGIKKLKNGNRKIALWGITHFSVIMFDESPFFKDPDLIFIDNATPKQKMIINDRKVYSPEILKDGDVSTVVIFYPNLIKLVTEQIHELYPEVKNIVNVCDLLYNSPA